MKTYRRFSGVSGHSAAKHSKYNRSPGVLAKIARAAYSSAQRLLWVAAVKGGVA